MDRPTETDANVNVSNKSDVSSKLLRSFGDSVFFRNIYDPYAYRHVARMSRKIRMFENIWAEVINKM